MKKDLMRNIFCATQEELKTALKDALEKSGRDVVCEDGYLYSQGTHPVLLVAHLDTVHKTRCNTIFYSEDGTKIMSLEGIGGDDRCGVIIILDILKKADCSVVFLEDEEIGCVGAKKFCKSGIQLVVNYAVEFDRKGNNDYVFYKDFNKDFEAHIQKFKFEKAHGSCSDISHIAPAFKIEAVNISCGYHNPHCWYEYVDFNEMEDITERATEMILEPTQKFDYVEDKPIQSFTHSNSYDFLSKAQNYYNNYYDNQYYDDYDWSWAKNDDVLCITNKQADLYINNKRQKFSKIYMDGVSRLYWDEELTKQVRGELYDKKQGGRLYYYSIKNRYPKCICKKNVESVYVTSDQALLIVSGNITDFSMVFVDCNNRIYKDTLLKKEIKYAELLTVDGEEVLDYTTLSSALPTQTYKVKK